MSAIRWGILSTGTIARTFAKTAAAMPEQVVIAAVASRSLEKANAFADEFGIERCYGSYEALARDPEIDVVYVATPHNCHFEDMKLLIGAGKHVLCEKSFTTDAAQAREIFALAQEKGVFVMEAFWTKLAPVYQDVEAWLKQGRIGEVRALTAQYGYKTAREARKFEPALAGGTLLDIGVYAIGFACLCMGYAWDSVTSNLVMNDAGTDATDAILLRRGNAVAQLTCAIGATMPVFGAIYGTKGRIEIPDFKNPQRATLLVDGEAPLTAERPFDVNGYEYEIRETEACLRAGQTRSGRITPEQTIAVMALMDEVRRQNALRFPFEA